jgi:hypothetical protein
MIIAMPTPARPQQRYDHLSCAKSRRGLIPSENFGKQAASRVWSRSRRPQFA